MKSPNDKEMSQGTTIQVYGRRFAGIIDMHFEFWYKIHKDFAEEPFKITGVSPFSIMGSPDATLKKYTECKRTNTRVKADIRKNFNTICEKAHCDWFVMDNSSALMGLTQINNQFYSLWGGEKTDFMDDYFNNNDEAKKSYIRPVQEGFSERLKQQYDLFIDAVLRNYSAERIILIRSSVPRFFSDNGMISKTKHSGSAAEFLRILDDYFAEKTKCTAIETPLRFFETTQNSANGIFSLKQWDLQFALESDIINIIEQSEKKYYVKRNRQSIADYIADGGTDTIIIADYFKWENYIFDDIVALFWLYEQKNENLYFEDIVYAILSNENSAPYLYTKSLFEKNVNFLKKYAYCLFNLDNTFFLEKIIVRLDAKHFLEISHQGLRSSNTLPDAEWSHVRFINNNYNCDITEIENALESYETYFERGRIRNTEPFVLRFSCFDDFIQSLYLIDYEDILSNENYCIALKEHILHLQEYKAKVDLQFFFDERTRICTIPGGSGLADHLRYFLYYSNIMDETDLNIYFNDLGYDRYVAHQGMEAIRVIADDIEPRRLSAKLSKKLRIKMRLQSEAAKPVRSNVKWYDLGLKEAYLVLYLGISKACDKMYESMELHKFNIPSLVCRTRDLYRSFIDNKCYEKVPIYIGSIAPGIASGANKVLYEKHCEFPDIPFKDVRNYEVSQLCLKTDAIAVHIRRGDYLSSSLFGEDWRFNIDYKKAIDLVYNNASFARYTNKHLLVFSDDMEWVRNHAEKLGLGFAGNSITFVNWNYHFDSIKDMHLMSMCKVVIMGNGNFALTAGLISKVADYIIRVNDKKVFIEWQRPNMEIQDEV